MLKETWTEETPENEKERIAKRQSNAAVALLKLGQSGIVWPLLKHSPDPRTEWCHDHYYGDYDVSDPKQPTSEKFHISPVVDRSTLLLRGGSFGLQPSYFRSAYRFNFRPSIRSNNVGFRPSRTYR